MMQRAEFVLGLAVAFFPVTSPLAADAQSILLRAVEVIE